MALAAYRKILFPPTCVIANFQLQQVRTTYVVKRRYPARLTSPNRRPDLRARHWVYDTIEDNNTKPQLMLKVLLIKYVEDVGQPGEVVTLKEKDARLLIMTRKAAYLNQENIDKYGKSALSEKTYSSKYVATTLKLLEKFVLNVSMNKENPWTLEPWHIRTAFRKAGVHVPEAAITMPENPIVGPDMKIEGKEFYVTVTINGQEKQVVRCRVHHWATAVEEKLPRVRDHWKFPAETIYAEDKKIGEQLPELTPPVFDENEVDNFVRPVRKNVLLS